MSIFNDIDALVQSAPSFLGYAPTGQKLPYVVSRPLLTDDLELALAGNALDWDFQFTLYCCAASVEASYNLAMMVIADVHSKRVGGTTLSASMGYNGAQVEGHYESAVVVQLNQGSI
jgi:hypothetical protein